MDKSPMSKKDFDDLLTVIRAARVSEISEKNAHLGELIGKIANSKYDPQELHNLTAVLQNEMSGALPKLNTELMDLRELQKKDFDVMGSLRLWEQAIKRKQATRYENLKETLAFLESVILKEKEVRKNIKEIIQGIGKKTLPLV